jgi:hypothetical protein
MRPSVIVAAVIGVGALAGGAYYWFVLRSPEQIALCESLVQTFMAVPESYHRTGAETMILADRTLTRLRFDAITRGGLPRSVS